jgi:hypothetical protein
MTFAPNKIVWVVALLSMVRAYGAEPATQPSSDTPLSDQVEQLRREVYELKQHEMAANAQATPATAPTAWHGLLAGYEKDRFIFQSGDGNFVLRPWFHLQLREATNVRQDYKLNGDDDTESGFEIRRIRLGFDGNAFTPDLAYFFNWTTTRASGSVTVTNGSASVGTVSNSLGGTLILEEAWVKYNLHQSPFFIQVGQIHDPIYHESMISSRYQQGTERSLTGDIFFNGDTFTEAATMVYDPNDWLRMQAGVDHGLRAANTNFLDYPNSNAFNYGGVARIEYKVMGHWNQYLMGDAGVTDPLLVFGLGSEYSERGHAGQTVAAFDALYAAPNGLFLFGSYSNRYTNHNFGIALQSPTGANIVAAPAGVAGTATNEYSLVGELGYEFLNHLEPFGRYEYMHLAGTPTGSDNFIQAVTGGVNYYFYDHRLKLTVQGTYLPRGIPIDDTPNDVLANPHGHGEFVGVAQFQLLL